MFQDLKPEKVIVKILKKNNGQALVEFVILLPIIVFILFIVIDFASVYYKKNHLEGILDDVVVMVENDIPKEKILEKIDDKTIDYTITVDGNLATINLEQMIEFNTPFSNTIFDEGFKINTKRVILYE